MKYHELNPTSAKFELDNQEFTLRAFDLQAQVWAYNEFATEENKDGIEVLSNRISDIKDADCYLRVAWHLMRRKVYFGTYTNFLNKIQVEYKGDRYWDKVVEIYKCVVKTLGVSQPHIEELEEDLELKKSLAAQGSTKLVFQNSMIFLLLDTVTTWISSMLLRYVRFTPLRRP